MAEMNLSYYGGSDQYSDGDVEDRILEAVSGGEEEGAAAEAPEIENSDDAFAFLYHLSPVRENILSWYPFKKGASALEIGAGPGAVTGVLCRKLADVTSVDLSKRRCQINYERHKDADNLTICVGNFNDMKFSGFFDYVILNGVFEYAGSFTEGKKPYENFLKTCAGFLKKDGVLLVAIENRLGLKYFAGAPEDHTGNYMEGLGGYQKGSGVKTFSKGEWRQLTESCGMKVKKFYYPYPDYKFPNEVFTDESLSADSFSRNNWNFNERRIELFPEEGIAEAMEKDGVLSSFMNSFLLELTFDPSADGAAEKDGPGQILYAKMNSDRARHFRIQTVIAQDADGRKEVVKSPLCPEAKEHLERMSRHEASFPEGTIRLSGKDYRVSLLRGRHEGDSLVYPFLEGKNLGKIAAEAAKEGDGDKIRRLTDALFQLILTNEVTGVERTGFRQVFGDAKDKEKGHLVCPANIDLIFDNLILEKDQVKVIDGEWIFDFPVPAEFILWRAVNELYSGHPGLEKALPEEKLLGTYGIGREEAQVFWKWADYFEKVYVGANRLAFYAKPVRKGNLKDLHTFEDEVRLTATLYLDRGRGFSEKDKVTCKVTVKEEKYEAVFRIPKPDTVKALRFDPLEGSPCICTLFAEEGRLSAAGAARVKKKKDRAGRVLPVCEFLTGDPSYLVKCGKKIPETVHVRGKVELQTQEWALERANLLLSRYQRIFRI